MKASAIFALLMALQLLCGGFLLREVIASVFALRFEPVSWALVELVEVGAILGLLFGVVASGLLLRQSLRRQRSAEASLRVASGAFMQVLDEKFTAWRLTPAERDVALFAIKGLSISEIAGLRSTSEGTVKAQTNAIYRKAQVSGRPQLLSLFIDELMGDALPGVTPAPELRIMSPPEPEAEPDSVPDPPSKPAISANPQSL
ncbi:helix-turn-helix transcriptional regulator [Maliponia aquimaris]|uniref:Bacterial regulatory proteins, luxR family n=1 Tax=Maliponia aquimaris TaxID=1673631 RepID=A0A238KTI6_9RHOB|nr:helix-turn-helix transcriptional regulator [Maliponia aquimaris]SMX46109.1 Bacterial regulatory proteins, luxR family [Maliponia aquimaris]